MSAMSPIQTEGGLQIFLGTLSSRRGNKPDVPRVRSASDASPDLEEVVLPHDAAFNYARWLTKSDADAEDVVRDASVGALRFFSSLRNDDARAWRCSRSCGLPGADGFRAAGANQPTVYNNVKHDRPDAGLDPEVLVIQQQAVEEVRKAVQELPADFREVIILRELERLSYREIAAIAGIPIGTVMLRLARAREQLQAVLGPSAAPTGEQS
jgi:RNA polymerase sigma-70 factor, ECF subfamily